jgi:hypothetical protein
MESSIKDISIKCELHTKESIRRICLDPYCEKSVFCIECILGGGDKVSEEHEQLVSMEEFLSKAAKFYEDNMKRADKKEEPPSNLTAVFSLESEQLEKLSKHIEYQKERVDKITSELILRFSLICNQKRDEIHAALNKELHTFRYNYQYFEKTLKKHFPNGSEEGLFPTKKELLEKIQKISSGGPLFAFVKDIKTDMFEAKKS